MDELKRQETSQEMSIEFLKASDSLQLVVWIGLAEEPGSHLPSRTRASNLNHHAPNHQLRVTLWGNPFEPKDSSCPIAEARAGLAPYGERASKENKSTGGVRSGPRAEVENESMVTAIPHREAFPKNQKRR